MHKSYHVGAVIPAAGSGNRMNSPLKKQFLVLEGKEVLEWTLINLLNDSIIDEVIIVVPHEEVAETARKTTEWKKLYSFLQLFKVVPGGETRQASVNEGIRQLSPDIDIAVVHDGVRPFVEKNWLRENLDQLSEADAIVAATPAVDTVKMVDENQIVTNTLDRSTLWQIQTPQVFWKKTLEKAHQNAFETGFQGTDDAGLVERIGGRVKLCKSGRFNIKITTPEDLVFGEAIIKNNQKYKETI